MDGKPIGFDLETKSADELFLSPRGEFVKVGGYVYNDESESYSTTDMAELIKRLEDAPWNYSHSGLTFDHLALAFHHSDNPGELWDRLTRKAVDTEILDRLVNPPKARDTGGSEDKYSLNAVCERHGVPGKTADLAEIGKKHGGIENIPADDPEYLAYLAGDVAAIHELVGTLPNSPVNKGDGSAYARREHLIASLNGRMTLNGMRVDLELLKERISEGEQRKRAALYNLRDDFDLPLGRFEWSGRGKDKIETWTDFDSPLSTLEGRKWLVEVWQAFGVNNPPITDNGRLATSAEVLRPIAESPASHPDLKYILDNMMTVTTTRTVYQTTEDHLDNNGDRVHPLIVMRQASGRSSVTSPGLTVFGKRGGRHREREIFVPEDGQVFVSADLSQIDMRGLAGHCQDPAYMGMFGFNEDGTPKDIHDEYARLIFGDVPFVNGHHPRRGEVKPIGHGRNYGLGQNKLIAAGHNPDTVRKFFEMERTRFPVKARYLDEIREIARSGELLETGFGRFMRPDPDRYYTQGPALMGQGTAAELLKEAMLRFDRAVPEARDYWRLMIHDELLFSFPVEDAEELSHELRRAMTFEWRGVPILCDVSEPGRNWGEVSAK